MLAHRSRLLHMYHHQIKTWTGSGVSFALVKNLTAHVHSHEKTWHCSDEQLSSLGDNTATTGDDKSWISVCRWFHFCLSRNKFTLRPSSAGNVSVRFPLQYKALCTYIIIVYVHVPTMAWTAVLVNINDILWHRRMYSTTHVQGTWCNIAESTCVSHFPQSCVQLLCDK